MHPKVVHAKRVGGDDDFLVQGAKNDLLKDIYKKMVISRVCKGYLATRRVLGMSDWRNAVLGTSNLTDPGLQNSFVADGAEQVWTLMGTKALLKGCLPASIPFYHEVLFFPM